MGSRSEQGPRRAGVLAGFWLGFIGVIIIAVLSPSEEYERKRIQHVSGGDGVNPAAPTIPSQDAVAEALRRDPSLAQTDDPATVKRLSEAVSQIQEEMRLKAQVAAVQEAQAEEAAALTRQRAETERIEDQRRAREAYLAGLSWWRRPFASHPGMMAFLAISLVSLLAFVGWKLVQESIQQAEATTYAEEHAAMNWGAAVALGDAQSAGDRLASAGLPCQSNDWGDFSPYGWCESLQLEIWPVSDWESFYPEYRKLVGYRNGYWIEGPDWVARFYGGPSIQTTDECAPATPAISKLGGRCALRVESGRVVYGSL